MTEERKLRKVRTGVVVSNKMDKTVVVKMVKRYMHAKYRKYMNKTIKVMAHDAENKCMIGDQVGIMETRPLSKEKCWRVVSVVRKED